MPNEQDEIVEHGDDAGGEQIVQGVHVGGDARDQAADRAAVEKAHGQALQMLENFLAQVVHGFLADPLHDAHLDVLQRETRPAATSMKSADDPREPAPRRLSGDDRVCKAGNDVAVDGRCRNR